MKASKLLPDLLLLLILFSTLEEVSQAMARDLDGTITKEDSWTSWSYWTRNWGSLWESANDHSKREAKHPVRQEIVDEIKARTTMWKPLDPAKNPMRKVPKHLVRSTLGLLGKDEYDASSH